MRDLPIAERVTPLTRNVRASAVEELDRSQSREKRNSQGREGTQRTRRNAHQRSFPSFAFLRCLGGSIARDASHGRSSTHAQGGVTPWVVQSQWESRAPNPGTVLCLRPQAAPGFSVSPAVGVRAY